MFQYLRNAKNPQLIVGLSSTFIIAACAYPVFSKDTRPGHEIFSSEKPEVIREAQEAQREEYRRLIKEKRKQLEEEEAVLKRKRQERK